MNKVKVHYSSFSATAFKFRGSVIGHVLPKVIFFLCWSSLIFVLNTYVLRDKLRIEASLITLLGLVISLLLVFRTNTAYDRYWEGRRLWSDLSMAVRSISRIIWVHVDEQDGRFSLELKRRVVNLLVAYAFACKHHLRGEVDPNHPELQAYLSHVPDFFMEPPLEPSEK
ncbi:hypothetical protein DSO57_1031564 [Entomophthora muscae]|uniref:Uncharacterized protein n=1 Tax=Entomophthora muscae TaxID=34485 RepID=A0ACC2TBS5_9FUNG|nr:hypothetical protein DSO57_1031564 [Entomophthora muscae]